jgi:hypothetical protein
MTEMYVILLNDMIRAVLFLNPWFKKEGLLYCNLVHGLQCKSYKFLEEPVTMCHFKTLYELVLLKYWFSKNQWDFHLDIP